jgi:hypothetical protein
MDRYTHSLRQDQTEALEALPDLSRAMQEAIQATGTDDAQPGQEKLGVPLGAFAATPCPTEALVDGWMGRPYNHELLNPWELPRRIRTPGVFAPLVGALVFKTSGGFEQSSQWVRFPYTPACSFASVDTFDHLIEDSVTPSALFLAMPLMSFARPA